MILWPGMGWRNESAVENGHEKVLKECGDEVAGSLMRVKKESGISIVLAHMYSS